MALDRTRAPPSVGGSWRTIGQKKEPLSRLLISVLRFEAGSPDPSACQRIRRPLAIRKRLGVAQPASFGNEAGHRVVARDQVVVAEHVGVRVPAGRSSAPCTPGRRGTADHARRIRPRPAPPTNPRRGRTRACCTRGACLRAVWPRPPTRGAVPSAQDPDSGGWASADRPASIGTPPYRRCTERTSPSCRPA